MTINAIQREILDAAVLPYIAEILDTEISKENKYAAILLITEKIPLTNEAKFSLAELNVISPIQELKKIYDHPAPQNRTENYPYFGAPTDPNNVVYKNEEGNASEEHRGLLGLSSRNDSSNSHTPITKIDILNYIQEKFNIDNYADTTPILPEPNQEKIDIFNDIQQNNRYLAEYISKSKDFQDMSNFYNYAGLGKFRKIMYSSNILPLLNKAKSSKYDDAESITLEKLAKLRPEQLDVILSEDICDFILNDAVEFSDVIYLLAFPNKLSTLVEYNFSKLINLPSVALNDLLKIIDTKGIDTYKLIASNRIIKLIDKDIISLNAIASYPVEELKIHAQSYLHRLSNKHNVHYSDFLNMNELELNNIINSVTSKLLRIRNKEDDKYTYNVKYLIQLNIQNPEEYTKITADDLGFYYFNCEDPLSKIIDIYNSETITYSNDLQLNPFEILTNKNIINYIKGNNLSLDHLIKLIDELPAIAHGIAYNTSGSNDHYTIANNFFRPQKKETLPKAMAYKRKRNSDNDEEDNDNDILDIKRMNTHSDKDVYGSYSSCCSSEQMHTSDTSSSESITNYRGPRKLFNNKHPGMELLNISPSIDLVITSTNGTNSVESLGEENTSDEFTL